MKRWAVLLAAAWVWCAGAQAAEIAVAVASNFMVPMKVIAAEFERQSGHQVTLSAGSTGKFYAQIKRGAPFDLLLAADDATPARLEDEGLGVAGSRFTYAIGQLVLWSLQPGLVDAQGEVLRRGRFERLALADPKLAGYGAAAAQTLASLQLLAALGPRLVQGASVAQAHQFVATGNAELGFVAVSQVFLDGRLSAGSAWVVPGHLHRPLRQDALLLNRARDKPAALALAAYLRGEDARRVMRRYGYGF